MHFTVGLRTKTNSKTDIASGSNIKITIAALHIATAKHTDGCSLLALRISDAFRVIWLICATKKGRAHPSNKEVGTQIHQRRQTLPVF